MIVICPSCRTRYRHGATSAPQAMAECSRCTEQFPLVPAKRTYILRGLRTPAGMAVAAPGVGAMPEIPPYHPPAAQGATDAGGAESAAERVEWSTGAADDPAAKPRIRKGGPGSSAVVEFLIAAVPSVAGAGLAYDLAGRQNEDPITWAALGGAVGLLLGWACLLWIARKD